jgi:HAD superfamily hydrolase (TIGR01509 family)
MRAFLFDLDGTLVLTDNIYLRVWSEILAPYNINVNSEFFSTHIQGNNDENVVNKLIPGASLDEISTKKNTLFNTHIYKVEPIINSIEFLKHVKQQGHEICIVTNCNRSNAEEIIKHIDIEKYSSHLVIGNECTHAKPSPQPYLHAMKLLNTTPDNCYIFEDSKSGLLSAIQSNPYCIVGIETHTAEQTLRTYGADIVILDYSCPDLYTTLLEYTPNTKVLDIKECLRNSLNNMDIESIHINDNNLKGGYISDVLSVTLTLRDNTRVSCIFKQANTDQNNLSVMADKLGLYDREYYFYESIAPYININIPKCYGIIRDSNFNKIGILLEDLSDSCVLNLDLNTSSIDITLKLVNDIAKMHSYFHDKQLTRVFDKLCKNNSNMFKPFWGTFVKERIKSFITKWDMILTENTIEVLTLIVEKYGAIQDKLSTGKLTLCHGDFKSPNIFYTKKDNSPVLIDWQYIVEGKGVQDIIFLMIESFESENIKEWFAIIVNYYYKKLQEHGCEYSRDEFDNDITYSICYFPTLVALWFGTIDQDELLDKNFPFFFIKKYLYFIENYVDIELLREL